MMLSGLRILWRMGEDQGLEGGGEEYLSQRRGVGVYCMERAVMMHMIDNPNGFIRFDYRSGPGHSSLEPLRSSLFPRELAHSYTIGISLIDCHVSTVLMQFSFEHDTIRLFLLASVFSIRFFESFPLLSC